MAVVNHDESALRLFDYFLSSDFHCLKKHALISVAKNDYNIAKDETIFS
jgi:hypothetical protein